MWASMVVPLLTTLQPAGAATDVYPYSANQIETILLLKSETASEKPNTRRTVRHD